MGSYNEFESKKSFDPRFRHVRIVEAIKRTGESEMYLKCSCRRMESTRLPCVHMTLIKSIFGSPSTCRTSPVDIGIRYWTSYYKVMLSDSSKEDTNNLKKKYI